jgi:hypothetical protein
MTLKKMFKTMKTKKLVGYKCFCDNFFLFWFLPFLFLFLLQTLEKYLLKKKALEKYLIIMY